MRRVALIFLCLAHFGLFGQSKWHFTYWMPYDNNLNVWADSINSMITNSVSSPNVTVSLQVDRLGSGGMQRYKIDSNGLNLVSTLDSENSHGGKDLMDYLKWVSANFEAENHAVIFLDHGGKLDEVGLDEFPIRRFLRIDSIRMALEAFNSWNKKPVELLFFQVCAKGSIEPMYEVSEVANYILTSQNKLGAPNFYYQDLFSSMSTSVPNDGRELATLIHAFERNDMYYSLTLLKTAYLDGFKRSLLDFIEWVNESEGVAWKSSRPLFILYDGVSYWDFIYFLRSFRSEKMDLNIINQLIESFQRLVVMHKVNPTNPLMKDYCGLSMMALGSQYSSQLGDYAHLRFFQDFQMDSVFERFIEMKE